MSHSSQNTNQEEAQTSATKRIAVRNTTMVGAVNTTTTATTTGTTTTTTTTATSMRTGTGTNTMPSTTTVTTTATLTTTTTKEKRGWLHSLTRRKKSQSQNSITTATTPTAAAATIPTTDTTHVLWHLQNNNNEPPTSELLLPLPTQHSNEELSSFASTSSHKRRDEKNAFQRFRKRIGFHFNSLRQRRHTIKTDAGISGAIGGTTDALDEFTTHSPIREQTANRLLHDELNFNFAIVDKRAMKELETEMVPFTHDYKRFIVKKWVDIDNPNVSRVMYRACSEMLGQVWYWGEISRCDAQKQLTDKPTGSFLVRDSESSGCQFTLSFRIRNVTLHYRLVYRDNYWHFEELQYESVVEMIEDILDRCTNNDFVCFVRVPSEMHPPFPVILKYPLSRYLQMPKLQDLCRRVIQRRCTEQEIAKLPLPPSLHEYLSEQRALVF